MMEDVAPKNQGLLRRLRARLRQWRKLLSFRPPSASLNQPVQSPAPPPAEAFHEHDWRKKHLPDGSPFPKCTPTQLIRTAIYSAQPGIPAASIERMFKHDDTTESYDDFLCLEFTPQYYCGNAVYGMEVSDLNARDLDSPAFMEMYQHFAFVMAYSAGSMSSYSEFQKKFEKVMSIIAAGGGMSYVQIVVVETQFSGSGRLYVGAVGGVPPFVREVPEGVGRAFVEDKGCAFVGLSLMERNEVKGVFGVVVESIHEVCRIHREGLGLLEKLRIFERGLSILREEQVPSDKLKVP